jgi:hypothetical protein
VNGEELSYELEDDKKKATEPVLNVAAVTYLSGAILSLVIYFFPGMPEEVARNIVGVIAVGILPLITVVVTRAKVWSPASVQKLANKIRRDEITVNTNTKTSYQKYLAAKESKDGPPEFEAPNTNEF